MKITDPRAFNPFIPAKALMVLAIGFLLTVAACTSNPNPTMKIVEAPVSPPVPEPVQLSERYYSKEQVDRGQYMVELLGCSTCHTDGALIGEPDHEKLLAGSQIGIAYAASLADKTPTVIFPGNLTADAQTGIGLWNESDIMAMLQTGVNQYGQHTLPMMPWLTYAKLSEEDALAIAAYLMSLPPVSHQVPRSVQSGQESDFDFVYLGLFSKSDR